VAAPLIAVVVLAGCAAGFRVVEPSCAAGVAGILAFVSWPAHEWLLRVCRGGASSAPC